MADARQVPRSQAKQRGRVVVSGRAEIACTIRDISPLGARLIFLHPTILPRTFRLVFGDEDQKVRLIWQSGLIAGVRFSAPVRSAPAAAPSKRLWPWSKKS